MFQHVSTPLTSRYLQIWLKTETRTDSGMSKLTNAKQQTKKKVRTARIVYFGLKIR
jgi:hypothetical protein